MHIAVSARNNYMLYRLAQQPGVDVDCTNFQGMSPLMFAVWHFSVARLPNEYKDMLEAIKWLLARGADPNKQSRRASNAPPLVLAVQGDIIDVASAHAQLKSLIILLVDNGAEINRPRADGQSIIHLLSQAILDLSGSKGLEDILAYLVSLGGDINLPSRPGGQTILSEFLHKDCPPCLMRKMLDLGAAIQPYEADKALRLWSNSSKLRQSYDAPKLLQEHVSPEGYAEAFRAALLCRDKSVFNDLHDVCRSPINASELVSLALAPRKRNLSEVMQRLDFDANYVSDSGRSYLHTIVARLGTDKCKLKTFCDDARLFIRMGTSLRIRDAEGLTVVQCLRRKEKAVGDTQRYAELRLLLLDAQEAELDVI
ncbi:hypothetical protein CDD83_9359 [Cordyceps sp. RAO-2017]|nr:hypothetical protein CDD83_9359 [Cordyceps sp. RAO-2017]